MWGRPQVSLLPCPSPGPELAAQGNIQAHEGWTLALYHPRGNGLWHCTPSGARFRYLFCLLTPLLLHHGSHPMDWQGRLLPGLMALPSCELRAQDAGICFSFALVPCRSTVTISSPDAYGYWWVRPGPSQKCRL